MERVAGASELLDGAPATRDMEANLRDLARVNRFLGGTGLSWHALRHVLARHPAERPFRLLDVGTGAADIPRGLLRRARSDGHDLEVEATDRRPEIVAIAARRGRAAGGPGQIEDGLRLRVADAASLPFEDRSFDAVHASLLIHHFEPDQVGPLLREMARVARTAVIINDLERHRRWWLAAVVLTRVATANRLTRHDAPLSVRRAYQPSEVRDMARAVGLRQEALFRGRFGHRYAMVLQPVGGGAR